MDGQNYAPSWERMYPMFRIHIATHVLILVAFVVVVYLTKRVLTVIYKGEGVNKKKAKGE
eukprot:scaffold3101_cov113-Alexandrium_tamarense.AAC.1